MLKQPRLEKPHAISSYSRRMSAVPATNPTPKQPKPTFERYVLLFFLLLFPVVVVVATFPPQRFRNDITEWGDHDSPTYKQFADFQKKFGVNAHVIVTWPGCRLDDPRVEKVTLQIEEQLADDVKQISNGQRIYRDLLRGTGLSRETVISRLRNAGVGKDGISTSVGFNLQLHASRDRGRVIGKLHEILKDNGVDPKEASFAGMCHNLYSLDREGLESPFRMVPQIMLMALMLTIVLVGDFKLALLINLLGTFTGCLSFNFVWLADIDMNAIIWPLPTLTMLLTVSASLHFLSYFEKAKKDFLLRGTVFDGGPAAEPGSLADRREVARSARNKAAGPIFCCTLTTALGLLSLILGSSEPVRQFGFFGAISISAANGLMLILLPAFLTIRKWKNPSVQNLPNTNLSNPTSTHWFWIQLVKFTTRFRVPIIIVALTLMVGLAVGVPKIKTGGDLQNFFPDSHPVLQDVAEVEESSGPLTSIELLLKFENVDHSNDRIRIKAMEALSARIVAETPLESCISAATFAPQLKRNRTAIQKATEINKLKALKKKTAAFGLLYISPDQKLEIWRVSCRHSSDLDIDMTEAQGWIKTVADETLRKNGEAIFPGEKLSIVTTGEFVLFDFVDRQFFKELILTYAVAFAVISLVVMLVLRTPLAMLIALPPNLFPAIVVLGGTGHLGFSLDAASLMTASVALGIAVDDTLHFMLWWKQVRCGDGENVECSDETKQTSSFAIESAMRYCGKAMCQTSLILGGSIILYGLCGFLPTVRFGLLLSAMMFAALVGDLILLPALLAGTKLFGKYNLDAAARQ